MGEDFKPGDVVVCVEHDECPHHANVPADNPEMIGGVFRVARLVPVDPSLGCCGGLHISGVGSFCAGTFRKLPKADEEFTASIRACKPSRNRVPA